MMKMEKRLYEIEITNKERVNNSYYFYCTDKQAVSVFRSLAFASNKSNIIHCGLWLHSGNNERIALDEFIRLQNVYDV